ncbi:flavin reductase family protein [candidate division WOR-3 bacterium]|nr:flavin reductase family protein [candidate division WOR-3 bacterium]
MMLEFAKLQDFYSIFPQTVAIIGAARNLMPAAWHTPLSADPPLYGVSVSPKRYTYDLLARESGFTVNFLMHEEAGLIAKLGNTSGREIDKLERFGLAAERAGKVNGMILQACYGAFECEKFAVHECGDHFLVVGQILAIHVTREVLSEHEVIDLRKVRPALYFSKDRYLTIDPATLAVHKK